MSLIRSKTQITAPVGTEAVGVETVAPADGWVTLVGIAALGLTVFNVKTYGATGNGTTDDKTSIQNAINAAQTAGGGIVFFPTGVYQINSGLLVSGHGVILMGVSPSASIIQVSGQIMAFSTITQADSNFDAVTFSATSGAYNDFTTWAQGNGIRSLAIRRNGSATHLNVGLKTLYQSYFEAEGVLIYNFGVGVYTAAQIFCKYNKITVTGYLNQVNPTLYGFWITHQEGGQASNRYHQCTFSSDFPDGTGGGPGFINDAGPATKCIGWYVTAGSANPGGTGGIQDLFVSNSESTNPTYGLYIDGTGTTSPVESFDVHFDDFSAGDGGAGSTAVYITNVASANGGAIDFNGGIATNPIGFDINSSSGITIRGVQFINNTTAMVQITNSTDVSVTQCIMRSSGGAFVTVSGSSYCTIANNNLIGGGTGVAFVSSSSNCTVTGNTMRGISANSGVTIASGCTSIVATGNAWGGVSNFTNSGGGTNNVVNNV